MPALAEAALDEREREALARFVRRLRERYGDDLDAVWLYGSRARGERTHDESDIDLLVITREERGDEDLFRMVWQVQEELGTPWVLIDPRQRSRAWVEDRRRIASFFLQEVDRDKIVLHGSPCARARTSC